MLMARGGDVGGLSMISLQACKGIGWGVENGKRRRRGRAEHDIPASMQGFWVGG